MVYTAAVSLKTGLGPLFVECVGMALMYLMTQIVAQWATDKFNFMWYAYIGNFIINAFCDLGAAYAITKITYSIITLG